MMRRLFCAIFSLLTLSLCAQRLELPAKLKGVPERIVSHKAYTLSFNRDYNNPNWVAWVLYSDRIYGTCKRTNDFRGDPEIPWNHRVEGYDYKDTGYDRGHMCPAADNKHDLTAMSECFYMSNMCPQDPTLNREGWERLETACRRWATQEDSIYIVCGPIYNKDRKNIVIGEEVKITVPTAFFKVVLSMRKGHEKAIGFYYSNRSGRQTMEDATRSVDEIEEITGMDFFPMLDDELENKVESQRKLSIWK